MAPKAILRIKDLPDETNQRRGDTMGGYNQRTETAGEWGKNAFSRRGE